MKNLSLLQYMTAKCFLANVKLQVRRRNKNKYKLNLNFLFMSQANSAKQSLFKAHL